MVSGSNCCDPWTVHLFLRRADGSFAPRIAIQFDWPELTPSQRNLVMRGHSCPHLIDWNRDGRADLVLSDPRYWNLRIGLRPLAGKTEVPVAPFALPEIPERTPYHFEFADLDGDGNFDLLVVASHLQTRVGPWVYDLYWCRNTTARGEPRFEAPQHLLSLPAPWEVNGSAVVNRGTGPDLAVSVTRNWKRQPGHGWTVESLLWLVRAKQ